MATLNDIKKTLSRLEGNVRTQIKAAQKGAENSLPHIPIGPGPIMRLRKAVRRVRRELTLRLDQLDRALAKLAAQQRKGRGKR
jgi:hypothetical protein